MATPAPKPSFNWKLLVAPVVLMGMNKVGLDYEKPAVAFSFRAAYVASQILTAALVWHLYREVKRRSDPQKPVKIKEASDDGTKPALYLTEREYDLSELQRHAQHFGIGMITTLLLHYYFNLWPALVLQIVMQPIQLYDFPLFQIYFLGKSPDDNPAKLVRPFGVQLPPPRWRDLAAEDDDKTEESGGEVDEPEPQPALDAPQPEAEAPSEAQETASEAEAVPPASDRAAGAGSGLRQRPSAAA